MNHFSPSNQTLTSSSLHLFFFFFFSNQLLESRPKIEPFRDFSTLEGKQHLLEDLGTELEAKMQQLKEWQKERDSIAVETEEFREEDMNRLRKVCIGE